MYVQRRERIDKHGKTVISYKARVYDHRIGTQRSKTFARKKDAEDWARSLETTIRAGKSTVNPEHITMGELAQRYIDSFPLERTRKQTKNACSHWLPIIGKNTLAADVRHNDVVRVAKKLHEQTKPQLAQGTIARYVGTLKRCLNIAVEDGFIAHSPVAARVKGAGKGKRLNEKRALTQAEYDLLMTHIPQAHQTMFYVWPRTGLRIGELRALRWSNVDLRAGTLYVDHDEGQYQDDRGFCPPKAGSSGTVYLTKEATNALREWKLQTAIKHNPLGLVFPGRNGQPFDNKNIGYRVLKKAATDAGLEWVTPHSFRHTFASNALKAGAKLPFVQKQMRHSDMKMTLGYVQDVTTEDEKRAEAQLLEQAL